MKRAFRGEIVYFTDDPRVAGAGALQHFPDGLLVVEDGRVEAAGPAAALAAKLPQGTPIEDRSGKLLVPGFVDAHIHYPQTDVIASDARQLLDWLESNTFPAEAKFADPDHAREAAGFFIAELLRNGTTTAAVYPTVHKASAEAFFEIASQTARAHDLRQGDDGSPLPGEPARYREILLRGCGRADRPLARARPARLRGDAALRAHLERRAARAVAQLMDEHPGVLMQTHVAENLDEVKWVRELYPDSRSYLEVYDRFRLLRPGALLGHCLHLDATTGRSCAASGATAVHCPTSNLFLGSGLFDFGAARAAGASIALATDVGGGTSFSMLRTMHEAYKVAQMGRHAFTAMDAFYLATLGGAKALGFAREIGSFETGREADFLVLDPAATPLLARRSALTRNLEERLFALMMLGDDRAVAETWVLGERASRRV